MSDIPFADDSALELQRVEPDWLCIGAAIERAAALAAPIFEANQWEWGCLDSAHVPGKDEIVDFLRDIIQRMYRGNDEWCRSGRFCIRREQYDGVEEIYIDLELAEEEVAELRAEGE